MQFQGVVVCGASNNRWRGPWTVVTRRAEESREYHGLDREGSGTISGQN